MTANTLPHRLRTYLGGDLGNEAADEIERLTLENKAFWLKYNTTIEPPVFVMPTIEQIARILERDGLTIVSAADAEKVKRCECDDVRKDAERYRWLRENWTRLTGSSNRSHMSLEISNARWADFGPDVVDRSIDKVMESSHD